MPAVVAKKPRTGASPTDSDGHVADVHATQEVAAVVRKPEEKKKTIDHSPAHTHTMSARLFLEHTPNDIAKAQLLSTRLAQKIVYDVDHKCWYEWVDTHWELVTPERLQVDRIAATIRSLAQAAQDDHTMTATLGSTELFQLIHEGVGAQLMAAPHRDARQLVVLCGPSGCGKTTLGEALHQTLGAPWVKSVAPHLIVQTKDKRIAGAASPGLMDLAQVRVGIIDDIVDKKWSFHEPNVKAITGCSVMNVRAPASKVQSQIHPVTGVLMMVNHVPQAPEDEVLRGRIRVLHCRPQPGRDENKALPEQLKQVPIRQQILQELVQGAVRWWSHGRQFTALPVDVAAMPFASIQAAKRRSASATQWAPEASRADEDVTMSPAAPRFDESYAPTEAMVFHAWECAMVRQGTNRLVGPWSTKIKSSELWQHFQAFEKAQGHEPRFATLTSFTQCMKRVSRFLRGDGIRKNGQYNLVSLERARSIVGAEQRAARNART